MCLLQIGEYKRMLKHSDRVMKRDKLNGLVIQEEITRMNREKKSKKKEFYMKLRYNLIDLLPKFSSVVMWIVIGILLHLTGILGAQSLYPSTQVEIIAYRLVMSDEDGCWSELQIINENRFLDKKTKDLIVDKIAKYELYRDGGESPILQVKETSGRISYYHLIKLPSDTSW